MGAAMADEEPEQPADNTPKIFKSMTGVIGGATAVVVALGGLYTAYDKFLNKPPAEETAPADDTITPAAAPQNAPPAAAQNDRKTYTTGDGGTLEWVDGMWVWTDKDGTPYRYKEETNDGTTIVAKLPGGGEHGEDVWLRWPVAGGQALQSFDDQENWNNPVKVTVEEPEAS
jgi:hypothetical protein